MNSAKANAVCNTGTKPLIWPNWIRANGAMTAARTMSKTATPTAQAF